MLRNFPHQINQLGKLHASLGVCAALLQDGADPLDDGELGYASAREGVYTFRRLGDASAPKIASRIRSEKRKSPADQGPRTFARDLRRTLHLMGLLEIHDGACEISPIGQRLLEFDPGTADDEYVMLWREAVLRIRLPPDGNHRHPLSPAPIMLRIARDFPRVEKRWLALALAADNDSETEYKRISSLISTSDFDAARTRTGATKFKAANAVKIIPALLEQVGLLTIDGGLCEATGDAKALLSNETRVIVTRKGSAGRRRRRAGSLASNVSVAGDIPLPTTTGRQPPDRETMFAALAALEARTLEHQELLRKLVASLQNVRELTQTRDKFDLLARSSVRNEGLLFEVKTGENYLGQGRLALGQLCLYEHFDVRPGLGSAAQIRKIAVFSGEPGQDARQFLEAYGVECIAHVGGNFVVPAALADYFTPTETR